MLQRTIKSKLEYILGDNTSGNQPIMQHQLSEPYFGDL